MVATKRRFDPNLQRVRVLLDGRATRAYVCTRCLKAGKVEKASRVLLARGPGTIDRGMGGPVEASFLGSCALRRGPQSAKHFARVPGPWPGT